MKKLSITLTTLALLVSNIYGYSQEERIKDMQSMAQALSEVQKGILYNNKVWVHEGVVKLKKASEEIEITPKLEMDYSSVFAKEQAMHIERYATKIDEEMQKGKKHATLKMYTKVLNQCVSCHNKIRKWNP